MGLGNSCCLGGSSTDIKFYHGMPSAIEHKYLSTELFSTRLQKFSLDRIEEMPRFIYDLDVDIDSEDKHRIYLACGSDGVFSWDITPKKDSEGNVLDRGFINWSSVKKYVKGGMEAEEFSSAFNGDYGLMKTGSGSSIRYGFDGFSQAYSVKVYNNKYLFIASGTEGLKVVDLENGTTKQLLDNRVTFDNEEEINTIFNKIKIFGNLIYIGTCGYDYPLLDYASLSVGDWYQVEYDITGSGTHDAFFNHNDFYGGSLLKPAGLFIYDIDKLFKQAGIVELEEGEEAEEINPFVYHADSEMHVNDIQPVAQNVYFAVGQREEKTGNEAFFSEQQEGGAYHINREQDGKVYKVRKNEVTGSYETEVYDEGFPFTALAYKGGDLYATTGSHQYTHGVRKNAQNFIDTESIMRGFRCYDPGLSGSCFLVDVPTGDFATVDGSYGAQIDDYKNPTSRPTNQIVCERYSWPYGTPETIANITTGIHVNSNYIYVSFFNNGFAVFDRKSGSLVKHRRSFINLNCGKFITSDENNSEFDKNDECTLSCGKIYSSRGRIFIIDSIQYVASGSGPGVYNPSARSPDVFKYSGLIKSFQQYRGIIEL